VKADVEPEREFSKIKSVPNLYRREVSGVYYLLVKRNGRQFRRSLKTNDFALAKRRLREFEEKASRLAGSEANKQLRFEELSERWLANIRPDLKPSSYARRVVAVKALTPFFRGEVVTKVGARHIEVWKIKRAALVSAQTANIEAETLRLIFRYALNDLRLLIENPAESAKVQKKLIDPAEPPLRSLPRDGRDLYIAASNSLVVALDNVSGFPVWLSDDLCRLATGGGFATRELFSDDEERIFSALRPVILNGIEEIATRSDLLDRCILLELPTISKEKRRNEADFWREFEQVRPGILGALLDVVACGLKNLPTTRLKSSPRMADFATWVVACEPAMGWKPGNFLRAYECNRGEANSLSLDASVIGSLILELAEQGEWVGTATEIRKKLGELAGEDVRRQAGWPKNGRVVSGQLKRIAPNLRAQGIMVNWLPRTSGRRQIQIFQVGDGYAN
jgi:hypothetical protein